MEHVHLDPIPTKAMVATMGGAYLASREPRATPLASALHARPPLRGLIGTHECLLHDVGVRLGGIRAVGGDAELEIVEGTMHIGPLHPFPPETLDAADRFGKVLAMGFAAPVCETPGAGCGDRRARREPITSAHLERALVLARTWSMTNRILAAQEHFSPTKLDSSARAGMEDPGSRHG